MKGALVTTAPAETGSTGSTAAGRAPKGPRRGITLIVALAIGTMIPVAALIVRASGHDPVGANAGASESSPAPPLLGDALAVSLGLKQVPTAGVTGCNYFIETQEDRGYCIDSVVDNEHDATMLMTQISGREPTSVDEEIFNLQQQLEALPEGSEYDAQRAELDQEIMKLREQQGA